MIVVADSSPLIVLVTIRHIEVLTTLFREVTIPPEVANELNNDKRSADVRALVANKPGWLTICAPTTIVPIPGLHAGELAAISLARELHADLLLIDETAGRRAASALNIPVAGTIGVLE